MPRTKGTSELTRRERQVRLLSRISIAAAILAVLGAPVMGQATPEPFTARRIVLDVAIDFAEQRLNGAMTLEIENWTTEPADRVSLLLNRLMEVKGVTDGSGRAVTFSQDVVRFADQPMRQVDRIIVSLLRPVAPGARTSLRLEYAGHLVGYTEVGWLYVRDRIDTAFTILRSDALAFPDIGGVDDAANRRAPRDEFTYEASVRVPARFLVATGGRRSLVEHGDGTRTWRYRSDGPSPFLNIAIAPFDTLNSDSIHVFYFRDDSLGARQLLANARAATRLLGEWFGPLRGNPNVTITEIPDGWGSQASLVAGIIQTAAAFRDSTRANEMYHELTHMWNAKDTEPSSPRWNEGLASFLEHLVYERVNGWKGMTEYQGRYVAWLRDRATTDSTMRSVPFIDYGKRGYTDASYSVGQVMFATLHAIVGEHDFNRIVGGFYQGFAGGGTTRDFVDHAKRVSSRDLGAFFDDWMFTTRWTTVIASASSVGDLANHYKTASARQS